WGSGIEAGGTFSRRAGERMEDALISAYASLSGSGVLTRVIAGDFDVVSAGGIVLWRGPSTPGDVAPLRTYSRSPVAPHTGSDRGHFLRGVAAAVEFSPGWKGALFLSGRSYAAGVDTSGGAGAFFDGAYTSPAAASKRNALHENLAGVLIECPLPGGAEVGMAMYSSRFDRTFVPADPNRLSGNSAGALGVHAGWTGGHVALRGAWGVIRGGTGAFTCAASFVAPGGALALLRYCDFPPRFDNPHALADGGWGDSRNSRSVTAILRSAGTTAASTECRIEAFEHPAPTGLSPIPRRGVELTLIWKGMLRGGTRLTLRSSLRRSYESSSAADSLGRSVRSGGPASLVRTFFSASAPPVSGLTFAARCELAGAAPSGAGVTRGVLLSGEFDARMPLHGTIGARVSFFRADTYDARLYDREESLPGVLSAPPLYGRGVRWYVRLSIHPAARFSLTCRYATTVRDRASCDAPRVPCDAREIAMEADASL
ncbi:MAG TPA: hypothetical protein VMM80_12845, partial [Bacteroidota bacterium]|nr:hypothetical protein [Bacteroidota bacterium]